MRHCKLILLALLLLLSPVRAQDGQAFLQQALPFIQREDYQGMINLVRSRPLDAKASVAVFAQYAQSSGDATQAQMAALYANVVGRILQLYCNDAEMNQALQANGILVPESSWDGTPLARGGETVAPTGATDWKKVGDQYDIASSLGNHVLALQLVDQLEEVVSQVGQVADSQTLVDIQAQLTLFRLAMMENLGVPSATQELARSLLSMVPKLSSEMAGPAEIIARSSLVSSLTKSGRLREARVQNQAALNLLQGSKPGERVARALLQTWLIVGEYQRDPSLSVNALVQKYKRITAGLDGLKGPETDGQTGIAYIWSQIFIDALVRNPERQGSEQLGGLVETEIGRYQMVMDSVGERIQSADDPGKVLSNLCQLVDIVHELAEAQLEMARLCIEAGDYDSAETFLKNSEGVLQQINGEIMPQLKSALELGGLDAEQFLAIGDNQRVNYRYHYLRARLVLAEAGSEPSREEAALALKQVERAEGYLAGCGNLSLVAELAPLQAWSQYRSGVDPSEGLLSLEQGIALARESGDQKGLISCLTARAKISSGRGDKSAALRDVREATGFLEGYILELGGTAAGAARVREDSKEAYDLLAELEIVQGSPQKAFGTLLKAQQLETVAALGASVSSADAQTRKEIEEVRATQARTRSYQEEVKALKSLPKPQQDAAKIEATEQLLADSKATFLQKVRDLRQSNPEYASVMSVNPIEFARLQKSIPPEVAVVQYFSTEDKLYIFVVTSDAFRMRQVPVAKKELTKLARQFRRLVQRGSSGGLDPSSIDGMAFIKTVTTLHTHLLDPIEEDVAQKQVLATIPSGMLRYVPYQALARKKGEGLEYLIERKQVVRFAKTTDIAQLGSARKPSGGALAAFGNPDGTLPAAAQEVEELGRIFPGARVFVGNNATKDRLAASLSGAAYLHLATHGQPGRDPSTSFLVMAGKTELTPRDIFELPLEDTQMVTLSACESAIGEDRNVGRDVTSLAEAFWAVGPPTVVASLWKVSDDSTRALMVEAYKGIKAGKSKSSAFQEAQLKLLKDPKYAHPFYWSPFVVFGDWR